MDNKFSVSVLIPTYNGANKLPAAFSALAKQTVLPDQVCVVVDGSIDHTMDVLNDMKLFYPQLKLDIVLQSNGGRAAAKNTAISNATGDLLAFLDDDMEPSIYWLASHVSHHASIKGSIASGALCPPPRAFASEVFQYQKWLHQRWEPKSPSNIAAELSSPYIQAGNFSSHKDILLALGMFQQELTDYEDRVLALKARGSGIPLFLLPDATSIHHDTHSPTFLGMVNRAREYEKARRQICTLSSSLSSESVLQPFRPRLGFKTVYKLLSHSIWIAAVDRSFFAWLPGAIRYRLYSAILTASSRLQ